MSSNKDSFFIPSSERAVGSISSRHNDVASSPLHPNTIDSAMLSSENKVREQDNNESKCGGHRQQTAQEAWLHSEKSLATLYHRQPTAEEQVKHLQALQDPDQLPQEERYGQDTPQQLRTFPKADERHGRRRSPGLLQSEQESDAPGESSISIQCQFELADFDQAVHTACSLQGGQGQVSTADSSPFLCDRDFVSTR